MQSHRVRERGQTYRTETNYGKMIQVPCTFTTSIWRITLKIYFPNCFGVQVNLASLYAIKLVQLWTSEDGKHANYKLHAEMNHSTFVKLAESVLPLHQQKQIGPRQLSYATEHTRHRTHSCCARNVSPQELSACKSHSPEGTPCPTRLCKKRACFS